MARTSKECEDAKITSDLIQQAGRADPDPPTEEDSDGEPHRRHQAREDTVQEEGEHPQANICNRRGRSRKGTTIKLVPNDLRK